mgnify:CR=1 FL=1
MTLNVIRSQLYSLFAVLTCFPEEDIWSEVLPKGQITILKALLEDLANEQINAQDKGKNKEQSYGLVFFSPTLTLEQLNIEYTSLFDNTAKAVSLHGRSYLQNGDQKLFEDLFRLYGHFGLQLNENKNDFWPDSLQMELEFMHYLTHLTTLNDHLGLNIYKAQRDFLNRQLLPLVKGISQALKETNSEIYAPMLEVLHQFIVNEQAYLNELIGDNINIQQVS